MIELFVKIWNAFEPAHELILAIVISLVTAGLLALFKPKVKLTWGTTSISRHKFKLRVDSEPIMISTEKLYVQNIGKKPATEVELILSDIPSSYTLWSPREHEGKPLENGGFSIKIPTLAPNELLIVDLIDIDVRFPKLIAVNCPDSIAQPVQFMAQRQFGKMVTAAVFYLMAAGFVGTVYLALLMVIGVD